VSAASDAIIIHWEPNASTHGRLYRLLEDAPARTQMFLIGNPLIALNMMRVHAEAGVYAPLRVMFFSDGAKQDVDYL
jgi:hypothetical protein